MPSSRSNEKDDMYEQQAQFILEFILEDKYDLHEEGNASNISINMET